MVLPDKGSSNKYLQNSTTLFRPFIVYLHAFMLFFRKFVESDNQV
jgi:hypothetical protein